MAQIEKSGGHLVVTLSTAEKVEGMHGSFEVPFDRVRDVAVLEEPIREIHGLQPSHMKLVGTYLPGKVAVGSFLAGGLEQRPIFAAVHHDSHRGVRITLEGDQYSALVLGCDDPEGVRDLLREARKT